MSGVLELVPPVCTGLGLVCAGAVLVGTRDVRFAVAVLLDFLLAAGLVRLGDDPTPRALLTAAVVVALRRLLTYGLRLAPARPLAARGG